MKKTKRIIPLLLIVLMLSTLFAGCTSDELSLMDALIKSSNITSMESKTSMTLDLNASGLSKADQATFDQIALMLNGSQITLDQKMSGNEAKTVSKSQTDVSMNFAGMGLTGSMWVDSDVSGATPKLKEIIKLPPLVTMSFPAQFQKPYMVMDVGQLMDTEAAGEIDFKKFTDLSMSLSTKVNDFIKAYATQFNPGFAIATKKDNKVVDGQTLSVYNLKLDDTSFKNLLDYTVKNFSQNESALSFIKELSLSIADSIEGTAAEKDEAKKEINKAFDDFKAGLPEFLNEWSKVMDILKNVKMLGDKGIDIDFGVDSNGYIVSESGTVDLLFDLKAISDAGEEFALLEDSSYEKQASDLTGIIKLTINFNSTTSNINKPITVNIPEVNSQNSFNYMDYMNFIMGTAITPGNKGDIKPPAKPPVKKDITAPSAPVVNKVLRTSTKVTGKAEAGSTVIVKKGKTTTLGKAVANAKGAFSVTIKPVKAKCTLYVTATDKAGNVSKATAVNVK